MHRHLREADPVALAEGHVHKTRCTNHTAISFMSLAIFTDKNLPFYKKTFLKKILEEIKVTW